MCHPHMPVAMYPKQDEQQGSGPELWIEGVGVYGIRGGPEASGYGTDLREPCKMRMICTVGILAWFRGSDSLLC